MPEPFAFALILYLIEHPVLLAIAAGTAGVLVAGK